MERINTPNTQHLYDVEVRRYNADTGSYEKKYIEVEANNRTQASSICTKLGYEVCSVNMVG